MVDMTNDRNERKLAVNIAVAHDELDKKDRLQLNAALIHDLSVGNRVFAVVTQEPNPAQVLASLLTGKEPPIEVLLVLSNMTESEDPEEITQDLEMIRDLLN